MGLFDELLKKAGARAQEAVRNGVRTVPDSKAGTSAPLPASGNGVSVSESLTPQGYPAVTVRFGRPPQTLDELKALPLSDLLSPYGTAALTAAALDRYEADRGAAHEMLNFLRGPCPMSPLDEQFLRDRLAGKIYVVRSFWAGTSPQNGYAPSLPHSVTFYGDPYTYRNAGYCRLNAVSSGADSPRQIVLRKKESTSEWFLWENCLLADIRPPAEADPWA